MQNGFYWVQSVYQVSQKVHRLMYIVANANLNTFYYELTNKKQCFNCKENRINVQTPLKNNPTKLKQEEDNNCRSWPGFSRITTMWRTCGHSSKKENQGLCSRRRAKTRPYGSASPYVAQWFTRGEAVWGVNKCRFGTHTWKQLEWQYVGRREPRGEGRGNTMNSCQLWARPPGDNWGSCPGSRHDES